MERNSKGQFEKGMTPYNKGTKGICKPNSGTFKKGISVSQKTQFQKGQTAWNKDKKHSKTTLEKISESRKGKCIGKENWNWIEDRSLLKAPLEKQIRKSIEYKLWRTAVFERDNYTCIWCGAKNGNGKTVILNADHIKPFILFPELRFAIDNGRTLCIDCHRKTDNYGIKLVHFIKNNNKYNGE